MYTNQLKEDLKLGMLLHSVWVVSIPAVIWPHARLNIPENQYNTFKQTLQSTFNPKI